MSKNIKGVLISSGKIKNRVSIIAASISSDYADQTITVVGVLNGSFVFVSDLIRQISRNVQVRVRFISLSSYGDNVISSRNVEITNGEKLSCIDEDVIIVEDIVDTGLTIQTARRLVVSAGARSVRVAALLSKPNLHSQTIDYLGFEIPDEFVVGYGLDHAGLYRNLSGIYTLEDRVSV
tara:strand:+ start:2859 stop:3395 length:537 start_codon:yes stop_codon:yes gene_type:complete